MNDQCALTPPYEAVEDMLRLMERGARVRLDCIPDDPTLLSASFGSESTPEMAKAIRADQREAALTELARLGQEIEGEQEKRDREIRDKALEEAAELAQRSLDAEEKFYRKNGDNFGHQMEASGGMDIAEEIRDAIRALKETS